MRRSGGYSLGRPLREITLGQVVRAMQEPIYVRGCLAEPEPCPREHACALPAHWQALQGQIGAFLDGTTLADVQRGRRPFQPGDSGNNAFSRRENDRR